MDSGDWIPEDVAQWLDHIGIQQQEQHQSLNVLYGDVAHLLAACPAPSIPAASGTGTGTGMRSSEDGVSGTVLQRLMQEHLRCGTAGVGEGGLPHVPPPGVPLSSDNLEEVEEGEEDEEARRVLSPYQPPQTQPRQEPQGQEHQVDSNSMEKSAGQNPGGGGGVQLAPGVPGLGSLELPSYEEAKSQSQMFRGQSEQTNQGQTLLSSNLGLHVAQNLHKSNQQQVPAPQQHLQTPYSTSCSTSSCPSSLSAAPTFSSSSSVPSSSSCPSAAPVAAKGRVEGRAWVQRGPACVAPPRDEGLAELKQGHVRTLSERIMQLSLERNGARQSRGPSGPDPRESTTFTSERATNSPPPADKHPRLLPPLPPPLPSPKSTQDHRGPPPEYPFKLKFQAPYSSSGSPGFSAPEPTPPSGEVAQNAALMLPPQLPLPLYHPQPGAAGGSCVRVAPQGQLVSGEPLAMVGQAQQVLEVLSEENQKLRQELLRQAEKTSKLQRLEAEVGHLSEAYESLVRSSTKRETLDKTMRLKLEGEIRRLHDFNRDLRDRLETANQQLANQDPESQEDGHLYLRERRESVKEMEKLELEAATLRSANEDQQRHIEILEQALNNAQGKVVRLEEELGKKQVYVERVERLQQALAQLQAACEKREQLEKRLRTRLERELEALRSQQRAGVGVALPVCESSDPVLLDLLREKEERILGLEADMMRWEQKYLEESAIRQFAMEAAATAATQRDTTIIQHSRSGSYSNSCLWQHDGEDKTHPRRCQDIESRMKELHAQLLEKDAMIKVLQQRSRRDSAPLRPARSVPSISITTGTHTRQASHTDSRDTSGWKGSASLLMAKEPMEHLPPSLPSSRSSLAPSLSTSFPPYSSSSLPHPSLMTSSSSSSLPLSSSSFLPSSSATLPLSPHSSLPSTPLLPFHSKSASRDSGTQTGRSPESVRVTPPTGRVRLGKTEHSPPVLARSAQSSRAAAGQKIRLPDSDLVEILI